MRDADCIPVNLTVVIRTMRATGGGRPTVDSGSHRGDGGDDAYTCAGGLVGERMTKCLAGDSTLSRTRS